MKVFITGGAGFIGSNLANFWARTHPEDDLTVYDALTYAGRRENLAGLEGRPNFRFIQGDLGDFPRLRDFMAGSDIVIHLAAETHNDRAIAEPLVFVRSNVLGTATLLEACRSCDVPRLHHVSTDEVYGALNLGSPARFDAESPYRPNGPYSASKAGADHLVRAWATTYGTKATLSNCGNNFGPFQFPEKLIPLAITRAITGRQVPLYGDGLHVRDWIFVEDHCTAIDAIVHRGIVGSTYLVSAGYELANWDVVGRVLARLGRGPEAIDHVQDRPGHDRRYALDASRLRTELGWVPRYEFDAGLDATIDWYKRNVKWWTPLMENE